MANRVGERLGDYRLVRLLGTGSFGDVYLGEHIYEDIQGAVKVFKMQLTPDKMRDFINEVRIIRLKHDHIVELLDFGIADDNTPYLVMKYAPNGTLVQRHPRGIPLPLVTAVSYIKQIASALQYAHDKRLIHRDVKPENMLLGDKHEVLLSDFGIAVVAHTTHSQRVEDVIGTALYMPPEQWAGKPVPATDQYALGIVAYEWLSGSSPFNGNMQQLMYQHHYAPPPPLLEKLPSLTPAVEQVILKAIAKEPAQRFATIQAFADALEQAHRPQTVLISCSVGTNLPLLTYKGHSGGANALAWSPDGRRIASASDDKTVQVWDATTGKTLLTYSAHMDPVQAVAWSPDGRRIASASNDAVQVWDATTGNTLLSYNDDWGGVQAVAWSPDGRRIASASNDAVQVWDATTGNTLLSYDDDWGGVQAVAWSPDGRRIASGSGAGSGLEDDAATVQVWDAATGDTLFSYGYRWGSYHQQEMIWAVAWSPDGKWIASASGSPFHHPEDATVEVWDAATGDKLLTYSGHMALVQAVVWSPDGRWIASASNDATVQVWDAATGKTLLSYSGDMGGVWALAWSPDGRRIASAGYGVQVWQMV